MNDGEPDLLTHLERSRARLENRLAVNGHAVRHGQVVPRAALPKRRSLVQAEQGLVGAEAERAELRGARSVGDDDRHVVQAPSEGGGQVGERLAHESRESARRNSPAVGPAPLTESHGRIRLSTMERTTRTAITANIHCSRLTPAPPHADLSGGPHFTTDRGGAADRK